MMEQNLDSKKKFEICIGDGGFKQLDISMTPEYDSLRKKKNLYLKKIPYEYAVKHSHLLRLQGLEVITYKEMWHQESVFHRHLGFYHRHCLEAGWWGGIKSHHKLKSPWENPFFWNLWPRKANSLNLLQGLLPFQSIVQGICFICF